MKNSLIIYNTILISLVLKILSQKSKENVDKKLFLRTFFIRIIFNNNHEAKINNIIFILKICGQ